MNFDSLIPADLAGKYDHLIVHCSATPPSMDVDANWIDREHRRRGWTGNGYHAVVTRNEEYQCHALGHRTRPFAKTGAHVGNCGPQWNPRCLGIVYAGGVQEDGRTPEGNATPGQLEIIHAFIEQAIDRLGIPEQNVMGHRDLIKITNAPPKACPSFSVRDWLGQYQSDNERSPFNFAVKPDRNKTLRVPKVYTVRSGDTLWGISQAHGVPLYSLRELNPALSEGNLINPGQKIRLGK